MNPADTRRWINVGLTLVQRRRRWTDVKPTLVQRRVSAGKGDPVKLFSKFSKMGIAEIHSDQTPYDLYKRCSYTQPQQHKGEQLWQKTIQKIYNTSSCGVIQLCAMGKISEYHFIVRRRLGVADGGPTSNQQEEKIWANLFFTLSGISIPQKAFFYICTISAQRLWRWSNIVKKNLKCFVFAGTLFYHWTKCSRSSCEHFWEKQFQHLFSQNSNCWTITISHILPWYITLSSLNLP